MQRMNIKIYKDESSNELLISLGPVNKNMEQIITTLLNATLENINTLKEDTEYQKENMTIPEKIEEKVFCIPDGKYKGMTVSAALRLSEDAITDIIPEYLTHIKENEIYKNYTSDLKEYIAGIKYQTLSEETQQIYYNMLHQICPNLIHKLKEKGYSEEGEGKKELIKVCFQQLYKTL